MRTFSAPAPLRRVERGQRARRRARLLLSYLTLAVDRVILRQYLDPGTVVAPTLELERGDALTLLSRQTWRWV